MLQPDTLLHDRYKIVELIGQGGMGAVYAAIDQRLRAKVALKQTTVSGDQLSQAFEREAQLLAGLRHPALPRVIDHFHTPEGQFLVMEFIPGEDFARLLKERSAPFPAESALAWADSLLDALDYLHTQSPPIIHRDIKPQNLKLTPRGEIVLLDFGLAKGSVPLATQAAGQPASLFGYTPQYAPLEQVQGTGTDPRSDLYSLAATLYHLVTGQTPADALSRANAVLNDRPDPLAPAHTLNPAVPIGLSGALQQALSLKSGDRFSSAAVMRRALLQALDPAPAVISRHPSPEPPSQRVEPPPRPVSPAPPTRRIEPTALPPTLPATGTTLPDDRPAPLPASQPRKLPVPLLFAIVPLLILLAWGGSLLAGRLSPAQAAPTTAPAPATMALPATEVLPPTADPREVEPTTSLAPTTSPAAGPTSAALGAGLPDATPTPPPPPPATNITNNPGRSDEPVVLLDRAGTLHVLWIDTTLRQGQGDDLLYRSRSADGAWSDQVVNMTDGFDLVFGERTLLQRPDGVVCALFYGAIVSTNPNTLGVYERCLGEGGWSPAQLREDVAVGGNRRDYQPVFLPDGQLAYLSIVSAGTLLFGEELELSDGFKVAYRPDLAAGPDGTLHAIWTRQGDPFSLEYRRSDDGGATWSEPERLNDDASTPGGVHTVLAGPDGGVAVAWSSGGMIYVRRWSAGSWGAIVEVSQGEGRSGSTSIGFAIGPDGLAHVAWQGSKVHYTRESPDGSWAFPRIIAEAPGSGSGPALVAGPGGAQIIWQLEDDALDLYYATLE